MTALHANTVEQAREPGRLPDMDDRQFAQWADLLESRIGMQIPLTRKTFLVTSVGLRMREVGCEDFQAYFEHLQRGVDGAVEWTRLVDRLTIHETRFYRDPASLALLREELPALLAKVPTLHVWSVGCASGEESYTLAMLIEELRAQHGCGYYGILASDVGMDALAHARRGIYSVRRLGELPQAWRERHLSIHDASHVRIHGRIRRRVCFSRLNVLDKDDAPLHQMHLIYCQNMLIYFDRHRRYQILDGFAERMASGGLLVLAPGESQGWSHPRLERLQHPATLAFRCRD